MTTEEINNETNKLTNMKLDKVDDKPRSCHYFKYNSTTEGSFLKKSLVEEPNNSTSQKTLIKSKQIKQSRKSTTISKKATAASRHNGKYILCNDETDREMWLLQILCQILNTESMQEIQSWLISSGISEKEAMKELILKALDGLNQGGRIELDNSNKIDTVDYDKINNSVKTIIENQNDLTNSINNNYDLEKKIKNSSCSNQKQQQNELEKNKEKDNLNDIDKSKEKEKQPETTVTNNKETENSKDLESIWAKSAYFPKIEACLIDNTIEINDTEKENKKFNELKITNLTVKSFDKKNKEEISRTNLTSSSRVWSPVSVRSKTFVSTRYRPNTNDNQLNKNKPKTTTKTDKETQVLTLE